MKSVWEVTKLGKVCSFEKIQGANKNLPYVGLENIESNTARFVGSIEPQQVKSSTFSFSNNHILYGRLRPYLNKVFAPDFDGHCSTEIFPIKPGKNITREFLLYWFLSDETVNRINETCTGSRMPRADMNKVLEFLIPIPPLQEQRRIVAILDEAFAGISAAKESAEKNLKNAKEVFESAINSIEGKKVNLGDYVEIKTGKLDANAAVENGKYPFFTCSREIFSIDNFSFDCEAILLAGNNAVGDFNVKYYNGKFNAYQRTYVITSNKEKKILCKYLYFQLLNSLKKFKEKSVGAATKFLKLGMIKEMKIVLPSLIEQEEIVYKLSCIQEQAENLESIYQQKLANLEELKKSILQKAFSGAL